METTIETSIQFNVNFNNTSFSFKIEDEEVTQFIQLSEEPESQIKTLLHNGYLLSKCIPPSKLCCPELIYLKDSLSPMLELFHTGGNSFKKWKTL